TPVSRGSSKVACAPQGLGGTRCGDDHLVQIGEVFLREGEQRLAGTQQRRKKGQPHLSTPAALHARIGLVQSDREGGDRRAIPVVSQTVWHRPARAAHCVSRAGLRACEWIVLETAPSRARSTVVCRGLGLAYRCVGSAGIAFV